MGIGAGYLRRQLHSSHRIFEVGLEVKIGVIGVISVSAYPVQSLASAYSLQTGCT
jgi:hypothetical protein